MNQAREGGGFLRVGDHPTVPLVTASVLVVTTAVSVLGFTYPEILNALQREPGVLGAGKWWRLLTPLMVHDGGWTHLLSNAAALVIVGTATERMFGRWRWLVLYLAGGLTGELAGYAWQVQGAGNSVAVLGLVGGLLAVLLLKPQVEVSVISAVVIPSWIAAMIAYALSSLVAGLALVGLLAAPLGFFVVRNGLSRPVAVSIGLAGLLGGFGLLALHDIHGPAIVAGALVGFGMVQLNGGCTNVF
jgi:membrane associated rhomboid family serine protease